MPTSSQIVGPLERRIIELLTSTNLTFKEIILKLDGEKLSASIGIIRRINRDNRYRRPRYDSKLTPAQRESLVEELRDHQGVKPNLSLLAKRYGVCHGSVWYWWDKLNRVKRCDLRSGGSLESKSLLERSHQQARLLALSRDQGEPLMKLPQGLSQRAAASEGGGQFIGRVSVVTRSSSGAIELPILMFSSSLRENEWLMAGAVQHLGLGKMFELQQGAVPMIEA